MSSSASADFAQSRVFYTQSRAYRLEIQKSLERLAPDTNGNLMEIEEILERAKNHFLSSWSKRLDCFREMIRELNVRAIHEGWMEFQLLMKTWYKKDLHEYDSNEEAYKEAVFGAVYSLVCASGILTKDELNMAATVLFENTSTSEQEYYYQRIFDKCIEKGDFIAVVFFLLCTHDCYIIKYVVELVEYKGIGKTPQWKKIKKLADKYGEGDDANPWTTRMVKAFPEVDELLPFKCGKKIVVEKAGRLDYNS